MPDCGAGAYPLTYCTNVLPGETLAEAQDGLERTAVELRKRWGARGGEGRFPLGLWWSHGVVEALEDPARRESFAAWLDEREFSIATLNCFPYGGFHRQRVKREVFRPGWHEAERVRYTLRAAEVLAELVPENVRIPISTLSGTHKAWHEPGLLAAVAEGLARCAVGLERLAERSGRDIVLAIEPEPFSTLETTPEVVEFFEESLFRGPGAALLKAQGMDAESVVSRRLGLCYDTCHQAVEFESPVDSLRRLRAGGVAVHKVQLSSAPALRRPGEHPEALEVLRQFVEPRYLHQTFARTEDGEIRRWEDLDEFFQRGMGAVRELEELRTHFHVPIDRASIPPLQTTQDDLRAALGEVVRSTDSVTLEVETYTFAVFPTAGGLSAESDLVTSLDAELCAAERFLEEAVADSER